MSLINIKRAGNIGGFSSSVSFLLTLTLVLLQLVLLFGSNAIVEASQQQPLLNTLWEDSPYSDKIFYVSTTRLFPNFTNSRLPGQVCEQEKPSYCLDGAFAFLLRNSGGTASSPSGAFAYQQADSVLGDVCSSLAFNPSIRPCPKADGRWWWAVNRTAQPRYVGTDLSTFISSGPNVSGSSPGDEPVKYWTGLNMAGKNMRACSSSVSGDTWDSSDGINIPGEDDSVQGATVGTGFTTTEREWLASTVERCNQSLPLLCGCRRKGPVLTELPKFSRNGVLILRFDAPIVSLTSGPFLCSQLFDVVNAAGQLVSGNGVCRVGCDPDVDPQYCGLPSEQRFIYATLPRNSAIVPSHLVRFKGTIDVVSPFASSGNFPGDQVNNRTITNVIRSAKELIPAVFPSLDLLIKSPEDCLSPSPSLYSARKLGLCDRALTLFFSGDDAGRPWHSGQVVVTPCPDDYQVYGFDVDADSTCFREMTRQELDSGLVNQNTTWWNTLTNYGFSIQLRNWIDVIDSCQFVRSPESEVIPINQTWAEVDFLQGFTSPKDYRQDEPIVIAPDVRLDNSCAPGGNASLAVFSYVWSVFFQGLRINRRRQLKDELYVNSTLRVLTIPKHILKSLRAFPETDCYLCPTTYNVKLEVFASFPGSGGNVTLFGDVEKLIRINAVSGYFVVKSSFLPDGRIRVDASASCDANIATTTCRPGLGLLPSSTEPRGLEFRRIRCYVFELISIRDGGATSLGYRSCSPSDFENPTESPTLPELPNAPTPAPAFGSGVQVFPKPLSSNQLRLFRFVQGIEFSNGFLLDDDYVDMYPESCDFTTGFECERLASTTIAVLPETPGCINPQVGLPAFPNNRVSIQDGSSIFVSGSVLYQGIPSSSAAVLWEVLNVQTNTFVPLGPQTPSTILNSTRFASVPNRPGLIVPSGTLYAGAQYTFRLTAYQTGSAACSGSASKEITFQVNGPPEGGSCTISPIVGTNSLTEFTFVASGWTDPNSPLTYAFELVTPLSAFATPLSDFSTSNQLTTVLSSPALTNNMIRLVVSDGLNAKRTFNCPGNVTLNPLYISGSGVANLPDPDQVFNDIANLDIDTQLRRFEALAAAAAQTNDGPVAPSDNAFIENWKKTISIRTVELIKFVRGPFGSGSSIRQVALQVKTLLSGLSAFSDLGEDLSLDVSDLLKGLVDDAANAFLIASQDTPGLSASDLLPASFGGSILDALTKLSQGIEEGIAKAGLRRRRLYSEMLSNQRGLQQSDPYVQSVQNLRAALNRLVNTLMKGFTPGSPLSSFKGVEIEVVISRENRLEVGRTLSSLTLGDTTVTLPSSVLDQQFLRNPTQADSVDSVDVALVKFRFNVRELVADGNLPPGFDRNNITIAGVIADNFTVQEITALLFISTTDPTVILDPFNLDVPINITIPFPAGYSPPSNTSGQTVACGAWDENFKGWSSEGCVVAKVTPTGAICSCTHASDFAIWNAFVTNLGSGVGIIVTIAVIVVGIMIPFLLILYFIVMVWARIRDKRDADGVQVGALILLIKNKIRLRMKQRKFFKLLRENAQAPKPLIVDLVKARELKEENRRTLQKFEQERKQQNVCARMMPTFIHRWFKAMWYDHSLIGVFTRFDPYYTRTQRATVISAVVVGNLFVSAFLFDLKTANDISQGFLIGVVFLAGIIVAVPVKMIARVLFRETEAATGSKMDRVTQIYRVTYMNQDILPVYTSAAEQADIVMILAFRTYYLAKADLGQAQALLADAKMKAGQGSFVQNIHARLFKCCGRNKDESTKRMKSMRMRIGVEGLNDEEADLSISDLHQLCENATIAIKKAGVELREACRLAKEEWEKVPRKQNARIETLRKQQSSIMKFAALLYDEAEEGPPRERAKRLKAGFLVVAWAIVIMYMLVCIAYTSYWLIAYTSIKPGADATAKASDANAVILAWLLASFLGIVVGLFVAEPAIQLLRFSIIPACLHRFGKGIVSYKRVPKDILDVDDNTTVSAESNAKLEDKRLALVSSDPEADAASGSIRTKAALADELALKQKNLKKGETHAETGSVVAFDFLAEVVEAIA